MNAFLAWFVKNPVAANLLMLIVIAAGLVSVGSIDNEFFPDIQPNIVRVDVPYPGAGPLEVEEQICIKIEEALSDVQGIKEVKSTASQGFGSVNIETVEGWDIQRMVNDVKSRVDAISTFPVDSERPIVSDLSMGSPVVDLVVFGGHNEQAIKQLAMSIKDELSQLPGVSQVQLGGTRDSVVSVEIPENALLAHGLSFGDIAAIIRDSSLNLPAGQMRNRTGDIQLQIYGQDYQARDFENIVVVNHRDGSQVTLGQIATITDTFEEKNFLVEYEGQIAAQLTVLVGENPDTIGTSAVVREFMAQRSATLPPGYRMAMWKDNSFYLKDRLNLLMVNALQGLALVFVLLLLFLRPLLAVWVTTGIAVAYLGTLATMNLMGVSINVVSTFAFLLILGIVVDDAIIISENIYSMHERNIRGPMAAIAGVTDIAKPVILAVLTTLIVFVPMLAMPGNMAQLFTPIPAVAIAALTFSLMESLIILPSHLSHLEEEKPPRNVLTKGLVRLRHTFTHGLNHFSFRIYQPLLDKSIRQRGATLALFLAALMICLSTFAGGWLQLQLTPEIETENLIAEAQFQEGAGFAHVLAVKNRMIEGLEKVRQQEDMVGFAGQPAIINSFLVVDGDRVTLKINLIRNGDRGITSGEIEQRLKDAIGEITGVKSFIVSSSMFGLRKDISLRLAGANIAELEAASAYLKDILAGYTGVIDVTDSMSSARQEIRIALRPNAQNLGLQLSDIARQVRHAFYGAEAQRIPLMREDVKVMVRYPAENRGNIEFLEGMRIHLADGSTVPFGEVATAEFVPGYTTIERTDRQRVVSVYADVVHGVAEPNEIVGTVMLNHRAEMSERFPSVNLGLEGQQKEQGEFFSTMVLGAAFALFCMYALLAVEFKSYLQPLYVLSAVPFGAAGAVIGHLMLGMDFSIPSALGVLATAGVVVNGNLVLIDCINRLRAEGMEMEAAVKQGARERLRPILLTSITTFFGLMPILLEPSTSAAALKPVVVSLSFGVVFATTITLLMVPALYIVFENFKKRLGFRERADVSLA